MPSTLGSRITGSPADLAILARGATDRLSLIRL
jgi:hypothetical protein